MAQLFSASIVLYHNDVSVAEAAVQSTLRTPGLGLLYLIDNSNDDRLRALATDRSIIYMRPGRNIGFGQGHNLALSQVEGFQYHAIINPDVRFGPEVIPALIEHLRSDPSVALVGPRLMTEDAKVYISCRRWPKPLDLIGRRFLPEFLRRFIDSRRPSFEVHDLPYDRPTQVDILSGAFLVCSTSIMRRLGGFDPRYFLYLEDYDLCRTAVAAGYRCIYEPRQVVIHRHGRHSYKQIRPLVWHSWSAIKYFNKWGWRPFY